MQTGRTVVVTRPLAQADTWVNALAARGWPVVAFPLIEIAPLADPAAREAAWRALPQTAWAMFVSANAVEHFWGGVPRAWPPGVRAGATGPGTAAALVAHGVPAALVDQPRAGDTLDSESLWRRIADRPWCGAQALVVRGRSADAARRSRDWLVDHLRAAGAAVTTLAVYQRRAPAWSAEDLEWLVSPAARRACWLFSSSEAIANLPAADWSEATAVVTHVRIAAAADRAGFGQVRCAAPDLDAVARSIESET